MTSSTNIDRLVQLGLWFLFLIGIPLSGQAQENTLTLDECLEQAKKSSLGVFIAKAKRDGASIDYKFVKASNGLQLKLNTSPLSYTKTNQLIVQPDGSISFLPIRQNNASVGLELSKTFASTNTSLYLNNYFQRYDNFTDNSQRYLGQPFRLGIRQGINAFNADKWNLKLAKQARYIADKRIVHDVEVLHQDVVQAYFDYYLAQSNLQTMTSNTANNLKLYDIAQERFSLGKINQSELLQLELGWKQAQKNAKLAQIQRKKALSKLALVLGVAESELANRTPQVPPEIPAFLLNERLALDKMFANHPLLKDQEYDQLVLSQNIDRAKKQYGISGFVEGAIGTVGSGETFQSTVSGLRDQQLLQVGLSIPIWDSGRRKYAVERAKLDQKMAVANQRYEQERLKNDMFNLVANWEDIKDAVEMAKEAYELAQKRYDIFNERYRLGDIRITEMTLAFDERDRSLMNYINTLRTLWSAYSDLRQLTLYDFVLGEDIVVEE